MQEQLADLRRLVFVPTPSPLETLPVREVNAIIDGREVLPKSDPEQESAELREANRILMGMSDNYEESW